MRSVIALAVLLFVSTAELAFAAEDQRFPVYTGEEFQALYEYAVGNTLANLEAPDGLYRVTGDDDLDERIWDAAFSRGYELRPLASGDLVSVGGVPMQPQAAEAWTSLRAEAREAGMRFVVSSAYRSPAAQRTQFLSRLDGTSDREIDATLRWYSVPGTSKHHAGYALDFRYVEGSFGQFRSTPDYAWLAGDNFAIPKRYGLVPSYPDDVTDQGPNPEPWEFVWVGTDLIRCGLPQSGSPGLGPVAAIIEDLRRCPGGMDPVQLPTWMG